MTENDTKARQEEQHKKNQIPEEVLPWTFPCQPRGKSPLIKDWQHQASTTKEDHAAWREQWLNMNIGLGMGSISGFVGIDLDGPLADDKLQEISDGDLPDTWLNESASRKLW